MPLQPFDARQVRAGEPVTAQAWNDVVNAIADLRGFVEATTGARVQVQVAGPSIGVRFGAGQRHRGRWRGHRRGRAGAALRQLHAVGPAAGLLHDPGGGARLHAPLLPRSQSRRKRRCR